MGGCGGIIRPARTVSVVEITRHWKKKHQTGHGADRTAQREQQQHCRRVAGCRCLFISLPLQTRLPFGGSEQASSS